jgi:translocation and assembly module TamB
LKRLAKWIGGGIIALLLLLAAAIWAIDTGPGHRFLIDRIERLAPQSGLRIRVGRIDGSIFGDAHLRDLRVYDAQGLLFDAPDVRLDWRPWAWLRNHLDIRSVRAPLATLHKSPKFNPSEKKGPILPGFDVTIGSLSIDRLRFEPAIAGQRRIGRLSGAADARSGRAKIALDAAVEGGGDRLALKLDAEPDRDRFDLEVRLRSPERGVFGAILGARHAIAVDVTGNGRWSAWKGKALADLSGRRVIDLDLAVDDGVYGLDGFLAPSLVSQGKVMRLTEPRISVSGRATLLERRLDGTLSLGSRALGIRAQGALDLARSAFDNVRITADLRQPSALFPNMTGRQVRLTALLEGGFDSARFEYLLTAPRVAFDQTGFEDVRASGKGRLGRSPTIVPLTLTARRVTGVGDIAGGILANLRVDGLLKVTAKSLVGEGLKLRSDKLTSTVSVIIDLVSGRYDVTISGQLARYLIPGLGLVDVKTTLKVVPGPNGRGTRIVGRGQAWVRRFDNAFLRGLAGGLPVIDTGLERGPDGILHLRGLRLTAPGIRLTGNGYRRKDGSFFIEGSGSQAQYGPFRLTLDGRIERPKIALLLARPMDALGLRDVRLDLDPTAQGFAYRAAGGSTLGPFTSHGAILLPSGQPATIAVAELKVSGTTAKGALRSLPGGFDGRLDVAGGGLDGQLVFTPVGGVQQIVIGLAANGVRSAGPPEISVRRGRLDATLLLDPAGTTVDATVNARGMRWGNVVLARLAGNAKLKDGSGQVRASFAGARGRAFDLQTVADITPDRIRLVGEGTIDRRPVKLTSPALLTREGQGWRLARTGIAFAGGTATIAGLFGEGPNQVEANLQRMPLSILDMAWPDLGLSGVASGTLNFTQDARASLPVGRMDMRVRGLARAGLVLSSKPIDVGVAAVINGRGAVARAVAASGGQVIGRAQARLAPLGSSGGLMERLTDAPLFAQIRYNGPADTLWRLTGVEIFDLSGPAAIAADIGGRLSNPSIRGSVRTANARLESAVTGTVLTNVKTSGTFGGSRLVLNEFSANAGGGTVTGRGSFNLAAAEGFGIDLAMDAKNAVLINRDDIGATVTGPITIRTDGRGGVIGGDVDLVRSRYVLGRASAASTIPRLQVRELNRRGEVIERPAAAVPWRLALKANARNRLMVTGLGLDSEWRAALDIGGTVESPAILGSATLLRGSYDFAGRSFDLERGTIRFNGNSPPDPTLDIVAQASIQGLNATIRVTGTGLRPEISFTSVPAMPEDELLSRLLFGTSITNLSAPEALQLAAAVAALQGGGGDGLNPINAVRRVAGLDRLRILPADRTTGQGTSIAAGKYITRRTYVELITDGQGYSATRIEFQITRWLSLLSSISTIGRQSVNVRISKDY